MASLRLNSRGPVVFSQPSRRAGVQALKFQAFDLSAHLRLQLPFLLRSEGANDGRRGAAMEPTGRGWTRRTGQVCVMPKWFLATAPSFRFAETRR